MFGPLQIIGQAERPEPVSIASPQPVDAFDLEPFSIALDTGPVTAESNVFRCCRQQQNNAQRRVAFASLDKCINNRR